MLSEEGATGRDHFFSIIGGGAALLECSTGVSANAGEDFA